jgi:hypothetical protein
VRYRILFKLSNRQKKIVDCTVRTVADMAGSYADVAGPYADVAGMYVDVAGPYADVAKLSWQKVGS